ncbi:MAG: zinc ribbon domain-containing protein [Deltaproteobacteria bacterium]|nr:zinc ribbon domain-containing protein [Deltaproteobacteria bacterium]
MLNNQKNEPCRKCKKENPLTNEYCSNCGSLLSISTMELKAQPKAKIPIINSFELKWVIAGVFVILGASTIAIILALLFSMLFLKDGELDFKSTASTFIFVVSIFSGISFASGGAIISYMSGKSKVIESLISSFICALLLGVAVSSISSQFLTVILILIIPFALLSALGAYWGVKIRS